MMRSQRSPLKTPKWWWMDMTNKPLRHVFRAMRVGFEDLEPAPAERLTANKQSDEFREDVMRALVLGSEEASLFLRASESHNQAHKFHSMAHTARGEDPTKQIVVRSDLWEMYQDWLSANKEKAALRSSTW